MLVLDSEEPARSTRTKSAREAKLGNFREVLSTLFEGRVGLAGGRHGFVMKHLCVSSLDVPVAAACSAWTWRSPSASPGRWPSARGAYWGNFRQGFQDWLKAVWG